MVNTTVKSYSYMLL